jgi:hypothetical protein
MVNQLCDNVDDVFRELINPPCIKRDKYCSCPFKEDNERRVDGKDVGLPPCPLYLEHEGRRMSSFEVLAEPAPSWRHTSYPDHHGFGPANSNWTAKDESSINQMLVMIQRYGDLWARNVWTGERNDGLKVY